MTTTVSDITISDARHARASGLVPAHTQTLAKGPGQYVRGVPPKLADRATARTRGAALTTASSAQSRA